MRGFALCGADTLLAVADASEIHVALSRPGTVERQQSVVLLIHIHTRRHQSCKEKAVFGDILNLHASRHDIQPAENTVTENRLHAQHLILRLKLQRHALVLNAKGRRKTGQSGLSVQNAVALVDQLHGIVPVHILYLNRALAVIACITAGKFHREGIKKRTPVPVILRGNKRVLLRAHQISDTAVTDLLSIIYMSDKAFLIRNADQITRMFRIQLKNPVLLIKLNIHSQPHFCARSYAYFPISLSYGKFRSF